MSEIRATTISDLAGTGPATLTKQSAAKVWISVNQTGTQAILNSFNVSSITDIFAGKTVVNYSSAMASATYAAVSSGNPQGFAGAIGGVNSVGSALAGASKTASRHGIDVRNASNTDTDVDDASSIVHGDLA